MSARKLPMAVIYDNMTADRFAKLQKMYWRAEGAVRDANPPELLAAKERAREKVAALEFDDEAYFDKEDAAWDEYYEAFDRASAELFHKLCARAASKAAWNTESMYLVGVEDHKVDTRKLSGVTSINVA